MHAGEQKLLPVAIGDFIAAHHVVSLATLFEGEPWAASCFYAFDRDHAVLLILSDVKTRHARAMLAHARVAGTIAAQPEALHEIRGVQLVGDVHLLEGEEADAAFALYCERHPVARLRRSAIWQLVLKEIKYTNNLLVFGEKTTWRRV